MQIITVTNTRDSGTGSFRDAIVSANKEQGPFRIIFKINVGNQTIRPVSPLPEITSPVIIDATTQPGYDGRPLIELDGSLAGECRAALVITGGESSVRGLIIVSFTGQGIVLAVNGKNRIAGNYIGTDLNGRTDRGNSQSGIIVWSSDNIVGGTRKEDRNILSGNSRQGIIIWDCSKNTVQGNYIGTTADGKGALGNRIGGIGLYDTQDNLIGGNTRGARNIISGNSNYGLAIVGPSARSNSVVGNFIGTDVSGTQKVSNVRTGAIIFNASSNIIGGHLKGQGNLISGNNRHGINIDGSATRSNKDGAISGGYGLARHNIIAGNLIGTDVSGTRALPNGNHGILVFMGQHNMIGGKQSGAKNTISGNGLNGITIMGPNPEGPDWRKNILDRDKEEIVKTVHAVSVDQNNTVEKNTVSGNHIGTDITGKHSIPNGKSGVFISHASSNTIGGNTKSERNFIAGNKLYGINIAGIDSRENKVIGNLIGVVPKNSSRCGNQSDGIMLRDAPANVIGGANLPEKNIIAGNGRYGVFLTGEDCIENQIDNLYSYCSGTEDIPVLNAKRPYHCQKTSEEFNQIISGEKQNKN